MASQTELIQVEIDDIQQSLKSDITYGTRVELRRVLAELHKAKALARIADALSLIADAKLGGGFPDQ